MNHLVQVGLLGSIGRFRAADRRARHRGSKVICRTERGLEVGRVLRVSESADSADPADIKEVDGDLLRQVTPDDRLILRRIDRFRDRAFHACQKLLDERQIPSVLVDVEHLFDGSSLYFYFLGDVTPEVEQLTGELAEAYEAKVQFRRFSQKLAEGCGPDCGTGESGCGSGGCGSCALKGKCK